MQTYLPNSTKKVHFHQELLVIFWKMCDYNKKFLYYVLKSSDVLEVLVPILYHLNDSRADQCKYILLYIYSLYIIYISFPFSYSFTRTSGFIQFHDSLLNCPF